GLRSLDDIEHVLTLGVDRAILGTVAVESPELVAEAVARFGAEKIAVGLDARDHQVRIRGWVKTAGKDPIILGKEMRLLGVERVIYTNIARDGVGDGIDVTATQQLAEETGLKVIASGGAASLVDVQDVQAAGLEGIIIGQALYTGQIDLREALQC
ncbi:MAG: HisA/HisF-related TIM barrel protein, partial [Chloroflexota bacterium]